MDVQFVAHRMDPEAGPVSGNGNARRAVHFDEGRVFGGIEELANVDVGVALCAALVAVDPSSPN